MVWGKNDVLFSCGLVRGFGPILLNEVDNSSKMFCHHNLLKFSFCCWFDPRWVASVCVEHIIRLFVNGQTHIARYRAYKHIKCSKFHRALNRVLQHNNDNTKRANKRTWRWKKGWKITEITILFKHNGINVHLRVTNGLQWCVVCSDSCMFYIDCDTPASVEHSFRIVLQLSWVVAFPSIGGLRKKSTREPI